MVRKNLRLVFPDKTIKEIKKIEKDFYKHFADITIESIKAFGMNENQMRNRYKYENIVNISEDGWFGKSIGPEQHLTHSIFRAIESGKYVLRSANNGTSAIINPLGVIEQKVDINKSGYIDLSETRKIEPTLFAKFGNKIFGFIILLYIFLIFSFKKLRNE